jgi:pilus assembly protein Flp/PilA
MRFLENEDGATAIEYSLIAGFIALAIIAAVGSIGSILVASLQGLLAAFG